MGEREGENVAFSVDMMGSVMILSSGIAKYVPKGYRLGGMASRHLYCGVL